MSDVLADRTPPHNIEAEQAVLGAILIGECVNFSIRVIGT